MEKRKNESSQDKIKRELKILSRKDEIVNEKSTFHLKGILDISSSLWLSSKILV